MSSQIPDCPDPAPAGCSNCSGSHVDDAPADGQTLADQRSGTNTQDGEPDAIPDPKTGQTPAVSAPVNPRGTGSSLSLPHRAAAVIANIRSRFVPTPPDSRSKILFYNQGAPYYEFTNFSNHSVWYNQKEYASSEHLFQSLKFTDAADSERIRWQRSPREALALAQRMRSQVRKDWISGEQNIKAMNKVLLLKFTQHENLRIKLLDTADALLVEDSPIDSFWGIGADGKGQNQLGLALMHVRETLRGFESQQDSTIQ